MGVRVKYAYREFSQELHKFDPNVFSKRLLHPYEIFYFMTDKKVISQKIIDRDTYIRLTMTTASHPEEFVQEGTAATSKKDFFGGTVATNDESDRIGGFMLLFTNFKEKTEFKKIEIKDRESNTFVTIYEEKK
jgi:hypothetical protein